MKYHKAAIKPLTYQNLVKLHTKSQRYYVKQSLQAL